MQGSKIITTASIWTGEGLLKSRWGLVTDVEFVSRVLDMTDFHAVCSLAVMKENRV